MNENAAALDTIETIYRAARIAAQRGHEFVTLEHLLASLLLNADVQQTLTTLGVDQASLAQSITEFLEADYIPVSGTTPRPSGALDEVVTKAVGLAIASSRGKATPLDLLVRLVDYPAEDSHAITMAHNHGVTPLALKKLISHGKGAKAAPQRQAVGPDGQPIQPEITTREEAEKFLEQYAVNLNKAAGESKIDPLIGREHEVDTIVQISARRTKNNSIIVGEPGVGKTAIAEGLALKIVRGEVPEILKKSTVYSLDVGNLVAGTKFRGEFEERMKQVLKALELVEEPILFIDEIHTVMGAGAGSQGSLDVANLLKPALAKGKLRCIGSTTAEEFRKHFEKDRALLRRFKRVDVYEPSIEDAKTIMRGLRSYYEEFHGVRFTDEALDAAVDLTARYVMNSFLPDKAIDVMDQAGARQRITPEGERKTEIGVEEIETEVAKVARIPKQAVAEDEAEKLIRLGSNLKSNVIGQDKACEELEDAVFLSRAGLREPNKPAGSYLFVGPTGVGKTEVARTLADTLGVELIKYDMSEYMEKHSVSKLIGAPPGYVGYGEGGTGSGKLINDIDSHPYCVLLLDEIEKAHPDVFNILLQVMDDGKLTSATGKTVNFRNVVLIMTSNAGAKELERNTIGFGRNDGGDPMTVVNMMFSPEFRNRLDAIVQFGRLTDASMLSITEKFVNELAGMAAARNVTITFTDEAKALLAKLGYDPAYGARPLKRVITDKVKKPLSRLMLTGPLAKGGAANVSVANDEIVVAAA